MQFMNIANLLPYCVPKYNSLALRHCFDISSVMSQNISSTAGQNQNILLQGIGGWCPNSVPGPDANGVVSQSSLGTTVHPGLKCIFCYLTLSRKCYRHWRSCYRSADHNSDHYTNAEMDVRNQCSRVMAWAD